jgi:Lysozyme like domain
VAVNGVALAAVAAGAAFAYAGIKGISVLKSAQNIIKGGSPAGGQATATSSTAAGGIYPTVSGAAPPGGAFLNVAATTYTPAMLQALWQQAGGSAATAQNAACHAMQESSGDPDSTSSNPDGGTNVGLWQLDTPGGVGAGYTVAQLQNPLTNARVTVMATRNGTDWSDWATPGC